MGSHKTEQAKQLSRKKKKREGFFVIKLMNLNLK